MGWKSLGQDAPGRGRDTSLKFEEREPPELKSVTFKADTDWVEEFSRFCKQASVSKSEFIRYEAWKEMQNYLRSE